MLNALSKKFHAWTSGWRVILLLIAYVVLAVYIMPLAAGILAFAANNSVLPLDVMFFYTPGQAFAMIEKYGEAGRALYTKIDLTVDILYPIIYTLFYGFLISWLFQRAYRPESKMQKWNVAPVCAWLFDLLENAGIITLLAVYPDEPTYLAWITMFFGLLKWAFTFLSIGLVFLGFVRAAMNRFHKQTA